MENKIETVNTETRNIIDALLPPVKVKTKKLYDFEISDTGNGQRMQHLFGHKWLFCEESSKWIYFDGLTWVGSRNKINDDYNEMRELFKQEVIKDRPDFYGKDSADSVAKLCNFMTSSGNGNKPNYALERFSQCSGQMVSTSIFDQNLDIIAFNNAVVDLRTGQQIPASPDQYIIKKTGVEFDPSATCPTWEKFINTVTQGDASLINYLQVLSGYWMTGHTKDQAVYMLLGSGRNGKSVFLNTLSKALGEYATSSNENLLTEQKTTTLATIKGSRLVVLNELGENLRAVSTRLKLLASSDRIQVERKYVDPELFIPTHKLLIATNISPSVSGWDYAICRRMRLIPFKYTIADSEVDEELEDKLVKELPGIVNWMLTGAKKWYADNKKIETPECVVTDTKEYLLEQDIIGMFMRECLEKKAEECCPASIVFRSFQAWAEINGIKTNTSQITLTKEICRRPGYSKVNKSNVPYIQGISVK